MIHATDLSANELCNGRPWTNRTRCRNVAVIGGRQRPRADAVHGTTQDGGGAEAGSSRPRDTPRDPRYRRRRCGGRASQEPRARQDDQVARPAVQQVGIAAGDGRRRRQGLPESTG